MADSEDPPPAIHKFKILILGDAGAGKTSLMRRFAHDDFRTSYVSTIGIDFMENTVEIAEGAERVQLQIWDTAGQERYRTLIRPYYRGAAGIALVYDVTDAPTFDHLRQWLLAISENTSQCQVIQKVVLANKVDLQADRRVSPEAGRALAESVGCPIFDVSAKSGVNVQEAFAKLAEMILESQRDQGGRTRASDEMEDSIVLPQVIPVHPRKEKKCCT